MVSFDFMENGGRKMENRRRVVGYLRVSTARQETEKNKAQIVVFANDHGFGQVEWVEEIVSGTKPWREREIAAVVDGLVSGDVLIVPELSRLGRSMLEIMEILGRLLERGAFVYAVKGNWRLDNGIQSKIIAVVMAMAAEIERELIAERTTEALASRKAMSAAGESWISKSGRVCKKLGRPEGPGKSKLDGFKEEIRGLLNNGATQSWIARRYKTSPQNLANWMGKHGIERPKE
jgi:DNA invertase Pin-like site-specific DNA recombinase